MVPPQFTAKPRPHPAPTDRKRNIGRPRLHLLKASAEPLRKVFSAVPLLPCTGRQLSERRISHLLVFFIAFVFMTLPLFPAKVNKKLRHNAEFAALFFVQYDTCHRIIHCISPGQEKVLPEIAPKHKTSELSGFYFSSSYDAAAFDL